MRRGGGEARNLLVINNLQRIAFFLYLFSCAFAERWYITLMQSKEEIMAQTELLQAALNLLNILNNVDDISHDEWEVINDARKIVEQHQLREVVPVEWEPWTVQTLLDFPHYQAIIDAHNAEMQRVTK
jgi:hypothetical protein